MDLKIWMTFCNHYLVLFLGFVAISKGLVTNEGKEFYLIVNEHIRKFSTCDLFLMTRIPGGARVKISVPLNPTLQPPIDVVVNVAESVKVSLAKDVLMEGFGKSYNGIYISSDVDIAVQVFSQSQFMFIKDTVGGYLAFPYTALGTEYITVTYCLQYSCYIGMMATANSTEITLTFKTTVTLNGTVCSAGTIKHLTLDQFEAFQIKSSDDLTGIIINSSNVISVTVGADGTPVDGLTEDYMIEQLPPVTALGTEHYLLPMPLRKTGDFVRVVALLDETQFRVDGVVYEMKLVGDHQDLFLTPTTLHFLHSSSPVLVSQFCKSSVITDTIYSDPNQLIVTPVRQWTGSYVFVTPVLAEKNNSFHIALVASNNCTEEVKLDEEDILETWIPLINSSVSMTTVTLTTEYHNITHKTGCRNIWGYIYGTALQQSWALPIGWSFQPKQMPVVPLSDKTITTEETTVDFQTQDATTDMTLSSDSHVNFEPTLTLSTTSYVSISQSVTPVTPDYTDILSTNTILPSYSTSVISIVFGATNSSIIQSYSDSLTTLVIESFETSPSLSSSSLPSSTSSSPSSSSSTISPTGIASNLTIPQTTGETHVSAKRIYNNLCECGCFNLYDSTVQARIHEAQLRLYVNKEKLGSTIRKKTSVQDDRRSAQAIGYAGIIFVVLVLALAVIPDILKVFRFLWKVICKSHE